MNQYECSNWNDVIQYVLESKDWFSHRNCSIIRTTGSKPIIICVKEDRQYHTIESAIEFLNKNIEF